MERRAFITAAASLPLAIGAGEFKPVDPVLALCAEWHRLKRREDQICDKAVADGIKAA